MRRNTFANGTRRGVMESPFGSRDWLTVRVRRLTLQLRACCATERASAGLSNVDIDLLKFTGTCGGSPGQTQDRRVLLTCMHRVTNKYRKGLVMVIVSSAPAFFAAHLGRDQSVQVVFQ
jgi:hypothetical protein